MPSQRPHLSLADQASDPGERFCDTILYGSSKDGPRPNMAAYALLQAGIRLSTREYALPEPDQMPMEQLTLEAGIKDPDPSDELALNAAEHAIELAMSELATEHRPKTPQPNHATPLGVWEDGKPQQFRKPPRRLYPVKPSPEDSVSGSDFGGPYDPPPLVA